MFSQRALAVPAALDAAADMNFPEQLAALRGERGLTQQAIVERVGSHVSRLSRQQAGGAQPPLDVFRRLAVALSVSADRLVFDTDGRGSDGDLLLRLEVVQRLSDDEKQTIKTVIEDVLLRHEARRYGPTS